MVSLRRRRMIAGIVLLSVAAFLIVFHPDNYQSRPSQTDSKPTSSGKTAALEGLNKLAIKGRAPKTNYSRAQFGDGWQRDGACDTRNQILSRDLTSVIVNEDCQVIRGVLNDPYTGKTVLFTRGPTTSQLVQIDHVVALGDAWQKGAQYMTYDQRVAFANDPLELLAVDGEANNQKSAGDAASWLPPNKAFRCQYVARQIAVKLKYNLWVTASEHQAMQRVLSSCPEQLLP